MSKQTLSIMVENKPGVLAKVAGLFGQQGWNIDSLGVGETAHPSVSWMTIVASIDESSLAQVTEDLRNLSNVLKVVESSHMAPVQRGCLW